MDRVMNMLNEMVHAHAVQLSSFDIDHATEAVEQLNGNMFPIDSLPSATRYCDYIDHAITCSQTSPVSIDKMLAFYSKLANNSIVDYKDMAIFIRPKEDIEKFRPDYLNNIPIDFENATSAVLNKKAKFTDIKSKYASGDYCAKVQKQLVKTSIPYSSTKDLLANLSNSRQVLDTTLIRTVIVPFCRDYTSDIQTLRNVGYNLKAIIIRTDAEMRANMAAITTTQNQPGIEYKMSRNLGYLKYNMYRNYLNLCAYITALYIRKMGYYSYNFMIYSTAITAIRQRLTPSEAAVIESYLEDHLTEYSDDDIYHSIVNNQFHIVIPHLQHILGMLEMNIRNDIAGREDGESYITGKYGYDKLPYILMNKAIIKIGDDFKGFVTAIQNENSVIDDVLSEFGFADSFVTQFADTLSNFSACDHQRFIGSNSHLIINCSIFDELSEFEKNVAIISSNLGRLTDYVKTCKEKFSAENTYGIDEVSYKDYCDALDMIERYLKDFATVVGKRMIDRLNMMVDAINPPDVTPDTPDVPEVENDYTEGVELENLQDIEDLTEAAMTQIHMDYTKARAMRDTGARMIIEEGEQQSSVVAGSGLQQADGSQNGESDNKSIKSLVERFRKWFKETINKFLGKTERITKRNDTWLSNVKEDILGLDYTNITINIAAYPNVTSDKLVNDINSATNKIKSINASNLPTEIRKGTGVEKYIYGFIPSTLGNMKAFKDRVYTHYVYGGDASKKLQSYSGDDARNLAERMIEFCEQYSKTSDAVKRALDGLEDASANKQQDIINQLGQKSQATTESVFTEAEVKVDGQVKRPDEDSQTKLKSSSAIIGVSRTYAGQALTVLEKKYLDYIKTLSKLTPKNTEAPKTEETPEEKQQDQQGENNQNK